MLVCFSRRESELGYRVQWQQVSPLFFFSCCPWLKRSPTVFLLLSWQLSASKVHTNNIVPSNLLLLIFLLLPISTISHNCRANQKLYAVRKRRSPAFESLKSVRLFLFFFSHTQCICFDTFITGVVSLLFLWFESPGFLFFRFFSLFLLTSLRIDLVVTSDSLFVSATQRKFLLKLLFSNNWLARLRLCTIIGEMWLLTSSLVSFSCFGPNDEVIFDHIYLPCVLIGK